jgi:hypothetical protein
MGLQQYPRNYSVNARTRRDAHAIALSPLALVVAVSLLRLTGLASKAVTPAALLVMGSVAGLWGLLLSSPAHRRVVLHEDGIEVLGWFSGRKLNRSEILGRRMEGTRSVYGIAHYVIVPVDKTIKVLRLPTHLNEDKDFRAWMDGIPKLIKGGGANS